MSDNVDHMKTKARLDAMGLNAEEGLAAAMLSRQLMSFAIDGAVKAAEVGKKNDCEIRVEYVVPAMLVICLDFINQDPQHLADYAKAVQP